MYAGGFCSAALKTIGGVYRDFYVRSKRTGDSVLYIKLNDYSQGYQMILDGYRGEGNTPISMFSEVSGATQDTVLISNAIFNNGRYGISASDAGTANGGAFKNIKISHCQFTNMSIAGIWLAKTSQTSIVDCTFDKCATAIKTSTGNGAGNSISLCNSFNATSKDFDVDTVYMFGNIGTTASTIGANVKGVGNYLTGQTGAITA